VSKLSDEKDVALVNDVNSRLAEYRENMDATRLRSGLALAMSVSGRGNQYLQDVKIDNALFTNEPERCAQVLLNAVNLIYLLSVLVHPFMPSTSEGILRQLNAPARSLPSAFSIDILPGHVLNPAEHLFKKIDNVNQAQEKAWQKQFGGDSVVAAEVTPAGPDGHAEGGKVPKVKGDKKGDKKAVFDPLAAETARLAKAAAAAEADKKKSPEERELEAKCEEQGKVVKELATSMVKGDDEQAKKLAHEKEVAKGLKTELADLRKKMKAASLGA
jgi:methionyl-tRNA synthetase